MTDQEKLISIINLISDKSSIIQLELDSVDPENSNYNLLLEIMSAQISILDEIYNDATKIKNHDN
jgi:hypothetical protein